MKTTTIRQAVIIPADPEQVYRGFTNPAIHSAMTGGKATGHAEVGAEFTAWDGYITGRYRRLEPHRRIVMDWLTSEWPEGARASRLELTLAPAAGGTRVILTQTHVPADQAPNYQTGWQESYWEPMAAYFKAQASR
ncbi:SRPBCC domain-containing protein [Candidatus Berkelbacteria bacterium]|nr:SRPBCC domain-containing protein [Candidatus Berkelbacteria bacterium]